MRLSRLCQAQWGLFFLCGETAILALLFLGIHYRFLPSPRLRTRAELEKEKAEIEAKLADHYLYPEVDP